MNGYHNHMMPDESDNDPDYIEEDISPNAHGRDAMYGYYQPPVSGGLPIKMVALDNSRRPFTPPFA